LELIQLSIAVGTHYIYTVQAGDTLYEIANRFSSSPQAIAEANHLYPPVTAPELIFPGQLLVVSTAGNIDTYYMVAPGDTLTDITIRFSTTYGLMTAMNPAINNPDVIISGQQLDVPAFIYNVEPGDTLFQIQQQFGIHRSEIIRANLDRPGFSPDIIWPGYSLIIPFPSTANITITYPIPGTVIQDGFPVAGWVRSFEGNVLHQVRDSNGVIVSNERAATASQGAPAYGFFQSSLPFDRQPTSDIGEVWVYTRSPRDGGIHDLVQVKIHFII